MKRILFLISQCVILAVIFGLSADKVTAQNSFYIAKFQNISFSSNFNFDNAEIEVFNLVNREREKKNLPVLKWNSDLARLARTYSQKMADVNFFSHFDTDGAGVAERARAMSIKNWRKIGENLFESIGSRNFTPVAIQMWMKSADHRRNILDDQFTTSGIGIAQSRDGKIYITQVFIEN